MSTLEDMNQLARMLETEWRGGSIDRVRARELAASLLPRHPEIRHTLTSVFERMNRG